MDPVESGQLACVAGVRGAVAPLDVDDVCAPGDAVAVGDVAAVLGVGGSGRHARSGGAVAVAVLAGGVAQAGVGGGVYPEFDPVPEGLVGAVDAGVSDVDPGAAAAVGAGGVVRVELAVQRHVRWSIRSMFQLAWSSTAWVAAGWTVCRRLP